MARHTASTKERIARLQQEYDLSARQAAFVDITVEEPTLPRDTRGKLAGYPATSTVSQGGRLLKSPKLKAAITEETRKRANIKEEMRALDSNPRQYLKERFLEHAADPYVEANQTRALELVGKMEGLFVERIEIDPGQNLRSSAASKYITGLLPETVDKPVDNV